MATLAFNELVREHPQLLSFQNAKQEISYLADRECVKTGTCLRLKRMENSENSVIFQIGSFGISVIIKK